MGIVNFFLAGITKTDLLQDDTWLILRFYDETIRYEFPPYRLREETVDNPHIPGLREEMLP